MSSPIRWPEGKAFAFSVFDDPDSQTLEAGQAVYAFLADCGLRTTKGVWPIRGSGTPSDHGVTCADPGVLRWLRTLEDAGFEIGYHNATSHTSPREETLRGLNEFREQFGRDPRAMAHHYFCDENLYWGEGRLSGWRRSLYNILTRGANHNKYFGHVPGHAYFWGDFAKERIRYVRNFVFAAINTLRACPWMPYHDPLRPFVNYWYASSEGANVSSFNQRLSEPNQEQLEREGGACIMYAHFGHGFHEHSELNARFKELIRRLSRRNGWFVPVSTILDFLMSLRPNATITNTQRALLERRWLAHKVRFGTA